MGMVDLLMEIPRRKNAIDVMFRALAKIYDNDMRRAESAVKKSLLLGQSQSGQFQIEEKKLAEVLIYYIIEFSNFHPEVEQYLLERLR